MFIALQIWQNIHLCLFDGLFMNGILKQIYKIIQPYFANTNWERANLEWEEKMCLVYEHKIYVTFHFVGKNDKVQ